MGRIGGDASGEAGQLKRDCFPHWSCLRLFLSLFILLVSSFIVLNDKRPCRLSAYRFEDTLPQVVSASQPGLALTKVAFLRVALAGSGAGGPPTARCPQSPQCWWQGHVFEMIEMRGALGESIVNHL